MMPTRLEDLALIGNCQISALVSRSGSIAWCCLPKFDSEPIFSTLLDAENGGHFSVSPTDGSPGRQRYIENTNIIETVFENTDGSFRVIDFAPRFRLHGRMFRPTQVFRIVEPISGNPHVRVACVPKLGWSKASARKIRGSNHITFDGFASSLRLTTDIPLDYVNGNTFALTQRMHLILTWGEPIEQPLSALCENFLGETTRYWQLWVKHCNIPPLYQSAVIRSALALKLHCYEDTGAIVAAMTTSIPESPGSGRTWDYRYCWLRDSYYAINAFRLLGHFEEREQFVHYLLNIAGRAQKFSLFPLYRLDGSTDLEERILSDWPGFNGDGPVRVGNGAIHHTQNDIFGETVLGLTPIFLDDRFSAERSDATLELVIGLARKAIEVAGQPDAGIWEYRTEWKPQTFSSLMCWAAADRMALIAARHRPTLQNEFANAANSLRDEIIARAWRPELGSFAATYDGNDLDAALLQMAVLRFLPMQDSRLVSTIEMISDRLSNSGWLYRYKLDDGFGKPKVAFIICTFWLVEALVAIGQKDKAKELMKQVHAAIGPLGLISEDYDTVNRQMWGNFPQGYSHIGLINAAFAASPFWSELL